MTELRDSIKASGIYQNLTVVPGAYGYTVIIGHRRLAAAKLAGLTELPCAVRSMTEQEQIATMMLENMQRSDLTPIEEADGFQLMMDFGMDIDEIAEKTGMSQSTIRRRTKLLKFDRKKLTTAQEKGATLADFARIEEIKDEEDRNNVLGYFGTSNFDWALRKALERQKQREYIQKIKAQFAEFAREADAQEDIDKKEWVKVVFCNYWGAVTPETPTDAESREYAFKQNNDTSVTLYRRKTAEERAAEKSIEDDELQKGKEAEEKRRARVEPLDELAKTAYERRLEFVKNFRPILMERDVLDAILEVLYDSIKYYFSPLPGVSASKLLLGNDVNINKSAWEIVRSASLVRTARGLELDDVKAWRALVAYAYVLTDDGPAQTYHDYNGNFTGNPKLNTAYEFLTKLGYAPAEEEMRYINGTHELFKGKTEEKINENFSRTVQKW